MRTISTRSLPAFVVLGLLTLTGCPSPGEVADSEDATSVNANENSGTDQDDPAPPDDATTASDIDVQIAPWAEIQKTIDAHAGKVVVVDLWSTTCAPCRREFPGLVKLHAEHGGEENGNDVACMSVSLDYYGDTTEPPKSFREPVTNFLSEQGATFDNFICSDTSDEVLAALEAVAVPVVLVYDRDGELIKMFEDDGSYGDEGFSYEQHIAPLVEELISAE